MPDCCAGRNSQNPVVLENKGEHSDMARRCSDQVNLHLVAVGADAVGKVIAVSLADGSSDGTLYPDRLTAAAHQHGNERWYAYIRIPPGGMPVCEAESFLWVHRMARERDINTPHLDQAGAGPELIPHLTREDAARQLRELRRLTGQ